MRLVRVPLRVSLVGGGSDLPAHYEKHGGAVVSVTISKYIYISSKPNTSLFPHKYRLVYSKVEECNEFEDIQHPIIKCTLDHYKTLNYPTHKLWGLDLDVMSDVPAGTGLGSSSAFTVGMVQLIHSMLNMPISKHFLADAACGIEINQLKEPIGKQDQYAAAFGGLNYFEFTKDRVTVNPITLPMHEMQQLRNSMHLVYIGGNRSASAQLKEQGEKDNSKILKMMRDQAAWMYEMLKTGTLIPEALGLCILEGWRLKKHLSPNISTPQIDTIIDAALKHGATGGKLLGAGGAGFVLLFCPPENRIKMLGGLKPLNLTYVPFNFDMEGCKVLYED